MADELHLSPGAHRRLQEELAERSTSHRKEISARIEEAREHGDLRENAEYHAAKEEQGKNEARVRQLEALLQRAVIVESAGSTDAVTPGCVVEIRMNGDDETAMYLVGSIEERDERYEVLSTSSPLGQALVGASVGATVTYQGPRRELSVTVVSISTP
jgi:transcription elongation factor GreA